MADGHIHDGPLAGADAVEEVAHVVVDLGEAELVAAGLCPQGLLDGAGAAVAAHQHQVVLVAKELHPEPCGAVLLARLPPVEGPVGVLEVVADLEVVGAVVHAPGPVAAEAFEAHGAGVVHVHGPAHVGEDVCAAVADLAAPEVHEPAERAVAAPRVVGHPPGWAEPEVPVEALGHGPRRLPAVGGVVVVPGPDRVDRSAVAVAYELHGGS